MGIYIIACILSMICAYYAANVKAIRPLRGTYMILCVCAFLPLTLVSALRYEVGTDWLIYQDYFREIADGTDKFNEPLFNLLNRVIAVFTQDSWWLFAICACIILFFTFRAFMEQSINPAFSILIFVVSGDFFNSQNQLRQAIAMSIFLFAMKYIKRRDWKKYFLWIIVATLIHTSALVYIPVYFIYRMKVDITKMAIIYGGVLVLLPVINKVMVFIISKTRYAWYFDSQYNTNNFYLLGFLVSLFFLIVLLFYYYYGRKHMQDRLKKQGDCSGIVEEDLEYNLMTYMYYISSLSILFSAAIPQMTRITTAFAVVTSLLFPRLVIREHRRNRRIVLYMLLVAVFAVKLLYDVYKNGWYGAVPYQWVFTVL